MLKILQYGDSRLRTKAQAVKDVKDSRIQQIIKDMFETLYNTEHCAGLSATQLDIKDPPRITVIDESSGNDQAFCLINPEITHMEGEASYMEGCMSICPQEIHAKVKRPEKITFTALDRDGKSMEICAEGFFAICVQHEIDHLNGILYIDHLSPLKRRMIEKRIAKILT